MAFLPAPGLVSRGAARGTSTSSWVSPQRAWTVRARTTPHYARGLYSATASQPSSPEETSAPSPEEGSETGGSEGLSFPALYDAWFKPGLQLSEQARRAVEAAHRDGVTDMELQWPVVPNLEEIAAGTMLNMEFGKQVALDMGMAADSEYQLIKRYLSSFCNVWWGIELSKCSCFQGRTVWIVSSDGVSRQAVKAPENIRFASLRNPPEGAGDDDVIIVLDPRFNDGWKKAASFKRPNGTLIFLNSQFNETYGLTGPRFGKLKSVVPVYFLKRVTRGFIFFSYEEGKWRACLENPDLSIEVVKEYDTVPKLRDVSNAVRNTSNNRYGGFFNDRYVRGFGGRL